MHTFMDTFNPTLLMNTDEDLFEYMLFEFVKLCRADPLFQEAEGYAYSQEHFDPAPWSSEFVRNLAQIRRHSTRAIISRRRFALCDRLSFQVLESPSKESDRHLVLPVLLVVEDLAKARENALAQVKLWATATMICLRYRMGEATASTSVLPGFAQVLPY